MDRIETKVVELVAQRLGCAAEKVRLQSRIFADLGADSLDMVDLMMDLEREFRISVSDDEMERIVTVQDVLSLVQIKAARSGSR